MPGFLSVVIFGVTLTLCMCESSESGYAFFKTGYEYFYKYSSQLSLESGQNGNPDFNMTGVLTFQALNGHAILQLADLSITGVAKESYTTEELDRPFRIKFRQNSEVEYLEVAFDEASWSVNVKKALASMFQLWIEPNGTKFYLRSEPTVYGKCIARYVMMSPSDADQQVKVVKHLNHAHCVSRHQGWRQGIDASVWAEEPVIHSHSVITYGLRRIHESFILEHIDAKGATDFQFFGTSGITHRSLVTQSFQLVSAKPIVEPHQMEANTATYEDLKYQIDELQDSVPIIDTNGQPQEELMEQLLDVLDTFGHLDPEQEEKMRLAIPIASHLDYQHLYQISDALSQDGIGWDVYPDLLAITGTNDSVTLLCDLMSDRKISDLNIIMSLPKVPMHLRRTDEIIFRKYEGLLEAFEEFALKKAAHLTFGALLRVASPNVADKYVHMFYDSFMKSMDFDEQLMYIHVLHNAWNKNAASLLLPLIRGESYAHSHIVRLHAFKAAWPLLDDPNQIFVPLFMDRTEDYEIRLAAFDAVMYSVPDFDTLHMITSYLSSEEDRQVLNYVQTTFHSLSNCKEPTVLTLARDIRKCLRYLDENLAATQIRYSGSYLLDYNNEDHNFGQLLYTSVVGSRKSILPTSILLDYTVHAAGVTKSYLSIYIRQEGLQNYLFDLDFPKDSEQWDAQILMKILARMKVKIRNQPPLNMEVMLFSQYTILFHAHINESTLDSLGDITTQFEKAFGTVLDQAKVHRPTDIGFPLELRLFAPGFGFFRVNISTPLHQLNFQYQQHGIVEISHHDPITGTHHGVRSRRHLLVNLPVNFILSDVRLDEVSVSLTRPTAVNPFVVHAYSTSFQKIGSDHLPTMTAGCTESVSRLALNMVNSIQKNPENEFVSSVVLNVMHAAQYLVFQPTGQECRLYLADYVDMEESTVAAHIVEMTFTVDAQEDGNGSTTTLFPGADAYFADIRMDWKSGLQPQTIRTWRLQTTYQLPGQGQDTGFNLQFQSFDNHGHGDYVVRLEGNARFSAIPSLDTLSILSDSGDEPGVGFNASVCWAHASSSCDTPDGHVVIRGQGSRSQAQKDLTSTSWPYSQCEAEKQDWPDESLTPLTPACFQSSLEQTTLRKYQIILEATKLPGHIHELAGRVASLLDAADFQNWLPSYVTSVDPSVGDQVELDVEFGTRTNELSLGLRMPEGKAASFRFDYAALGLASVDSLLPSTHFSNHMLASATLGTIASCLVTPNKVVTLDNVTYSYNLSSQNMLVTSDCSLNPKYAVFLRRIDQAKSMGMTLFIGKHVIHIEHSGNSQEITVDGIHVDIKQNGYAVPDVREPILSITRHEYMYFFYSAPINLFLQYSGEFLAAVVPSNFRGLHCGMCGNYDGEIGNEYVIPGSKPIIRSKVADAYTTDMLA